MKTIFTTLLFLICSFGISAEEYKAPSLKLNDKSPKTKVKVKKGEWESGLSYKVEENPTNDRNIASDEIEEKTGRDPSSTDDDVASPVEHWDFDDIENHP